MSQPKLFDIPDDADDLTGAFLINWIGIIPQEYLLPDRVFVGKIAMRESLVDDYDPRSRQRVMFIQDATFFERNL